jgi:endonuclease/exonuclease/phosphatase family metal-dependent hydrolase
MSTLRQKFLIRTFYQKIISFFSVIWSRKKFIYLTALSFFIIFISIQVNTCHAQLTQIYMDGKFEDWNSFSPLYTDPSNDQSGGFLDFGRLWVTNDGHFLYLRIEVGEEINLQDLNNINIFLDTDNNSATGIQAHGIGAELKWNFGQRSGIFRVGSTNYNIFHNQIGVVTSPTVTSTEFEISLDRSAKPVGTNLLFPSNTIKIVFADESPGQDRLPDINGGVIYNFTTQFPPGMVPISIKKSDAGYLRMMTYNVLSDGLFDPSKVAAFTRLLRAIQPDIIGFEEIYNHSAQETASQVESILSSTGQQQWYGGKAGPDNIVVSRYPIENVYEVNGNGAFVLNLDGQSGSKLLFIVAHLPCCANNDGRQWEIDAIMAFIRDAKSPGGIITLPNNTPIIITGDLNLVGYVQQLTTLLTGEIINTGTFGPLFSPDWDNSDFWDLLPMQTNQPQFFTWFDPFSSFSPGRLDFFIYSDSVIESKKGFVLFTSAMDTDTLSTYNLQPNDAVTASDHLLVVFDFQLQTTTAIDVAAILLPHSYTLEQNYPNPFNPETVIEFSLPEPQHVKIEIYDISGRKIRTLVEGTIAAGVHQTVWDGKNDSGEQVGSGMYIYIMTAGSFIIAKKMMLLK